MAWIPSHQSMATHRKTLRMAALLGIGRPQAIGHLHLLWWWAIDNAGRDGELKDALDGEIAGAAQWDGDAAQFVAACVRAGYIDEKDGGKKLHNWEIYGGKVVRERASNRKRMRNARAPHVQDSAPNVQPHVNDCAAIDKTRLDKTRLDKNGPAPPLSPPLAVPFQGFVRKEEPR